MALDQRKYERKHTDVLRDLRPSYVRLGDWLRKPSTGTALCFMGAFMIYQNDYTLMAGDLVFLIYLFYFFWLTIQDRTLAFKMPMKSKWKDKNNEGPGRSGKGEGILYLGNVKDTKEEVWFTNSDARTHILYLGTTGAGKTEGLKSMVTNALTWGSGFIYVDGKADTDLWSSLSSLVRRFGRDDDLLVLNYMTGNSDVRAPSNSMNPFSSGSASYLTNMLVSLMPDAEGDNAMWKERAVALVASLMPALTWKRDNQDIPMSVSTIREYLNLNNVIKISRDEALPEDIRHGIKGYLDTLPGYVDDAFDDQGNEKPAGPNQPQYDTTTPRQQHGYLSMQFTRSLQSLGDEYGYIFDTQAADVDMIDTVLNRRILVVLIPALEKSSDETANLGKIVAATLKGMMGSTLGSTVEGESATVIENKPTHSSTPFMTVFDEVGYYTAQGMAVMAAQARSLGFCLVFSGQDLPAMKKRVREEANSITANCNIKIFGKLEDPTETKDFFEKTVGSAMVIEASGFQRHGGGGGTGSYVDSQQASLQIRPRASYDGLKAFKEGEAVIAFGERVADTSIFYCNPGLAKAMRVTRYIALPPPDEKLLTSSKAIAAVRDRMVHKTWTAMKADVAAEIPDAIKAITDTLAKAKDVKLDEIEQGMVSVIGVHNLNEPVDLTVTKETKKEPPVVVKKEPTLGTEKPKTTPEKTAPPLTSKPKEEPPSTDRAEEKAPEAKTEDNSSSGNPMSFFSTKKTANEPAKSETPPAKETKTIEKPEPPAVEPAVEKEKPVSWEDLMKDPDTGTTATTTVQDKPVVTDTEQGLSVPLDAQTQRIIDQASQKAGESLFKKTDGDDENKS